MNGRSQQWRSQTGFLEDALCSLVAPHSQDLGLVQRSCARRDGEATPLPLGMFYSMAAGGKSRAEQTQESLMSDLAQATQRLSSHLHRHYFTKPLGFFLTGSHRQVAGSRGRLSPRAAFGRPEGHRAGVESRGGAEPPDFSLLRQKPRLSSHKRLHEFRKN